MSFGSKINKFFLFCKFFTVFLIICNKKTYFQALSSE